MRIIDARGLACPGPVLEAKASLGKGPTDTIKVIVDNEAAQHNVSRFLVHHGFEAKTHREGNDFHVIGSFKKGFSAVPAEEPEKKPGLKKIMVMVATDRMGFGDDELGLKLMANFIKTLNEIGPELWRLIFVNNGVKLTIKNSEVLPSLKAYEKNGLQILVCGTCLTHFKLLDEKQVGETTNMLDIVTAMQVADKVINI